VAGQTFAFIANSNETSYAAHNKNIFSFWASKMPQLEANLSEGHLVREGMGEREGLGKRNSTTL